MTSESQHPGQEPANAAPGAAGPAHQSGYGTYPVEQTPQHPVGTAADMGWAPPPPPAHADTGPSWGTPLNGETSAPPTPSGGFPADWASPPNAGPTPAHGGGFPPDWASAPYPDHSPAAPADWSPAAGTMPASPAPGWSAPADAGAPAGPDWSSGAGPTPASPAPPAWAPAATPPSGAAPPPAWDPTPQPGDQFAAGTAGWPGAWQPTSAQPEQYGHRDLPQHFPTSPAASGDLGAARPGMVPPGQPGSGESVPAEPPGPTRGDAGQRDYSSFGQAQAADDGWHESSHDSSVYVPGPAPGVVRSAAVPLPRQETRIPGAALAASPPADFEPAAMRSGPDQPYESRSAERPFGDLGGGSPGQADPPHPWSPEGFTPSADGAGGGFPVGAPPVPAARTSSESVVSGPGSAQQQVMHDPAAARATASAAVSASATVPAASRIAPPADHPIQPEGTAPQSRVYGRPATPEPPDDGHLEQGAPDSASGWGHGTVRDEPSGGFDAPSAFPTSGSARVTPPPPGFAPPSSVAAPQPGEGAGMHAGFAPYADLIGNPAAYPTSPAAGTAQPTYFGGPADNPFGGPADNPQTAPWGAPPVAPGGGYPTGPGGAPGQPGSGRPDIPEGFGGPAWAPAEPPARGFEPARPEPQPLPEPPPPQVRNGRVLAAVLAAAVFLLVVPLGIVWLVTRSGDSSFDPAVGACVKQDGSGAVVTDCGEAGAYTVVSKVDDVKKCADPAQPHITISTSDGKRVLCLQSAAASETKTK